MSACLAYSGSGAKLVSVIYHWFYGAHPLIMFLGADVFEWMLNVYDCKSHRPQTCTFDCWVFDYKCQAWNFIASSFDMI